MVADKRADSSTSIVVRDSAFHLSAPVSRGEMLCQLIIPEW
jgi:hypothetical protein